jgi:transposase InsO family protein
MRVCRSATAMEVIEALEEARRRHGRPKSIRVDQGSQFTSKELDLWAYSNGVVLDFSRPGKPTDNAYAESYNAIVRMECLGQHWFLSLDDARERSKTGVANTTKRDRMAQSVTDRRSPCYQGSGQLPEPSNCQRFSSEAVQIPGWNHQPGRSQDNRTRNRVSSPPVMH